MPQPFLHHWNTDEFGWQESLTLYKTILFHRAAQWHATPFSTTYVAFSILQGVAGLLFFGEVENEYYFIADPIRNNHRRIYGDEGGLVASAWSSAISNAVFVLSESRGAKS